MSACSFSDKSSFAIRYIKQIAQFAYILATELFVSSMLHYTKNIDFSQEYDFLKFYHELPMYSRVNRVPLNIYPPSHEVCS